jgi:hypothetical protein
LNDPGADHQIPGLFALVIAPAPTGSLDAALDNGWFFEETNGFNGAARVASVVVDDLDASFWTEFQRLGGLDQLAYPISQHFLYDGYSTQVFQKAAMQWRPPTVSLSL